MRNLEEENAILREELFIVKRSLNNSLEIQAGLGTSVECSKLEDVLQEENDELLIENIDLKIIITNIKEHKCYDYHNNKWVRDILEGSK